MMMIQRTQCKTTLSSSRMGSRMGSRMVSKMFKVLCVKLFGSLLSAHGCMTAQWQTELEEEGSEVRTTKSHTVT